jgi:hypothetical protein
MIRIVEHLIDKTAPHCIVFTANIYKSPLRQSKRRELREESDFFTAGLTRKRSGRSDEAWSHVEYMNNLSEYPQHRRTYDI